MIAILYRWKLKAGAETRFGEAWSAVTRHFRAHHGSLGSRLHRAGDGTYFAYAQWRTIEDRASAFADETVEREVEIMNEAVETRFEPVVLEVVEDLLSSAD